MKPTNDLVSRSPIASRASSGSPEPEPDTLPPKQRMSASKRRGTLSSDIVPPYQGKGEYMRTHISFSRLLKSLSVHGTSPPLQPSEPTTDSPEPPSDIEILEDVPTFVEPPVWVHVTSLGELASKDCKGSTNDCMWWPAGVRLY